MIEIDDEMIATHSGYRLTIALIEENRGLKAENERLAQRIESLTECLMVERRGQEKYIADIKRLVGELHERINR